MHVHDLRTYVLEVRTKCPNLPHQVFLMFALSVRKLHTIWLLDAYESVTYDKGIL
jgi:hypothetical protein